MREEAKKLEQERIEHQRTLEFERLRAEEEKRLAEEQEQRRIELLEETRSNYVKELLRRQEQTEAGMCTSVNLCALTDTLLAPQNL